MRRAARRLGGRICTPPQASAPVEWGRSAHRSARLRSRCEMSGTTDMARMTTTISMRTTVNRPDTPNTGVDGGINEGCDITSRDQRKDVDALGCCLEWALGPSLASRASFPTLDSPRPSLFVSSSPSTTTIAIDEHADSTWLWAPHARPHPISVQATIPNQDQRRLITLPSRTVGRSRPARDRRTAL